MRILTICRGKTRALLLITFLLPIFFPQVARAESSVPQTDQTPITPLGSPASPAQPRYISGFGLDNTYTIFYEDRHEPCTAETWRIYFNQTTTGPFGFSATSTATDLCETHFTAKNWPITIGATTYAYRGWGAQGNNPFHAFYVSNNLTNWTQIYLGTGMFSDPYNVMGGETINYGFHDIIQLNGNYIGFAESAGGNTYIVWSDNGDDHWNVIAKVGGSENTDGPLALSFTLAGPIPTGNFLLMELDGEVVYAKLMVPGNRNATYLAINRAAAQATTPALIEAAFLNPSNWTWRDGTAGVAPGPANAVITTTAAHGISEVWTVPASDYRANHVILYTANYGSTRGVGCAAADPQCLVVLPPSNKTATSAVTLPATGFQAGIATRLNLQTVEKMYSSTDIRLEIPSLGINIPVVGIPLVDGKWDTTWLYQQAGWLEGSAFPTWAGNSALAAHVYNADGQPGPFVNLKQLKYGDEIRVLAWGQVYSYSVRDNTIVLPNAVSTIKHEEYSWLTLITCQGYNASSREYLYRRVVRAVLIGIDNAK